MRKIVLPFTTNGSGAADVQTPVVNGLLHAIYADDGDLADTVDITITDAASGSAILTITNLTADALYMPRGATHSTAGAAALYAGSGTAVNDRIPVSGQIRVVAADGGDTKTGTLTFWVQEC